MNNVIFSSASDEWSTPQNVYDQLNDEFNFNLDPCATHDNHKCNRYFTKEQNGLNQWWVGGVLLRLLIHHIVKYQRGLRNVIMKV